MVSTDLLRASPVGSLVPAGGGQMAFVPAPLPDRLELSPELVLLLDEASRAVATLAGVGQTLPNPHLLIRPFLRREAVLSSRIEGTQASMGDVLREEATPRIPRGDAREVINYIGALELGQELLHELPICMRLVHHLHARLLEGVRGQSLRPGQLRDRQVWIGGEGAPIEQARYVPPPAAELAALCAGWEGFVNANPPAMPPLVESALIHYQFEAIHPYADGNGRIGRLLIILHLIAREVLPLPLLYLSAYFERTRSEYYDQLLRVSTSGDWVPWLTYFLIGVREQARDAMQRAQRLSALRERYREQLQEERASATTLRLLDELFSRPVMTSPVVRDRLGVTQPAARKMLLRLRDSGILTETPDSWPRLFSAEEIIEELQAPGDR